MRNNVLLYPFRFFCIIIFLLSSIGVSADSLFLGVSALNQSKLELALNFLSSTRKEENSLWLFNNLNIKSGSGQEISKFLSDNIAMIVDQKAWICPVNERRRATDCTSISGGISYLAADFSLIRYVDLKGSEAGTDFLIKSADGKRQLYVNNGKSILVKRENEQQGLSVAGSSFFTGSQMVALAASNKTDNFNKNYKICKLGLFEFSCQNDEVGFFSSMGIYIVDSLRQCIQCTERDKVILKYIACKNLLSVLKDGETFETGRSLLFKNRASFIQNRLNVDVLEKIYSYRLIH